MLLMKNPIVKDGVNIQRGVVLDDLNEIDNTFEF